MALARAARSPFLRAGYAPRADGYAYVDNDFVGHAPATLSELRALLLLAASG